MSAFGGKADIQDGRLTTGVDGPVTHMAIRANYNARYWKSGPIMLEGWWVVKVWLS